MEEHFNFLKKTYSKDNQNFNLTKYMTKLCNFYYDVQYMNVEGKDKTQESFSKCAIL